METATAQGKEDDRRKAERLAEDEKRAASIAQFEAQTRALRLEMQQMQAKKEALRDDVDELEDRKRLREEDEATVPPPPPGQFRALPPGGLR